jgi:hypothetical protein
LNSRPQTKPAIQPSMAGFLFSKCFVQSVEMAITCTLMATKKPVPQYKHSRNASEKLFSDSLHNKIPNIRTTAPTKIVPSKGITG